ncbi:YlbF/YmcA family competence regulator [Schinkia azotoformans]|uniref:YlbF family regulator n=1 Tax=Schinkia azotoformans TaxID=1454 RepID=UPI002DB61417|nr:YlbF family regulator [Schinkia azotoformans]MEC1715078.1 YlbF family regulator [Schinkia azotoformans]MEC1745943.1 YlbF family regulator [Schinkia azotoformans]MEC1758403.1 YlbF family regulator [Schinkia azotoformans]MEC1780187.1 YlbF family regulator [Schinkia azotoformans]MED4328590.1 YlbF family regulator [Schinkia azotoformans]
MANVYDVAYTLEKAIRDSDDFKRLKQLYDIVNNDASSKRLFDSFRETQFELQQKQMMGEDISEEDIQKAQQQFTLIGQHEGIAQLMQAEERMSMIISDLTRVIMKPLEELYGAPEELQ